MPYHGAMQSTAAALGSATAFARAMRPDLPLVEQALESARRLFAEAGVTYLLVGGVAVIHHGYVRTTRDLDVLLERRDAASLGEEILSRHGFVRIAVNRLRHVASGANVDLLLAGDPRPRQGAPPYPSPAALGRSAREADVVDLGSLLDLKLTAARHQDLADVVALLKPLDEVSYLTLEASLRQELRSELLRLRRDALEELGWERNR